MDDVGLQLLEHARQPPRGGEVHLGARRQREEVQALFRAAAQLAGAGARPAPCDGRARAGPAPSRAPGSVRPASCAPYRRGVKTSLGRSARGRPGAGRGLGVARGRRRERRCRSAASRTASRISGRRSTSSASRRPGRCGRRGIRGAGCSCAGRRAADRRWLPTPPSAGRRPPTVGDQRRVAIDFREVFRDVAIGVVLQLAAQPLDAPRALDGLVHRVAHSSARCGGRRAARGSPGYQSVLRIHRPR